MHEMSVTQQILDIAVARASEAGSASIKQINLVIGDMSSVLDDCVQFYFDFLSQGTIAAGADLTFKRIPVKIRCRRCAVEYNASGQDWSCPQCREMDVEIIAGNELYIDSIEVE